MSQRSLPPNSPGDGSPVSGEGSGAREPLVTFLAHARRQMAATHSAVWFRLYIQVRAICAFAPTDKQEHEFRKFYHQIGYAQNIPWRTAARQVNTAYLLHTHFPLLCDHLRAGDVTPQLAEVFADESFQFTRAQQYEEFLKQLLPRALIPGMTAARLRRHAKRIAETLFDTPIEERSEEALSREARNEVQATDLGDGVVALRIIMSAVDGYSVVSRIKDIAIAKQDSARDSNRTVKPLPFLQHETATDLLTGRLDPEYAGIRGQVRITVPLLSLETGTSRHTREELHRRIDTIAGLSGHASLDGYGPVPVSDVSKLCALQHEWYRMFVDPDTGVVLHTDSRQPSAPLKRFLTFRDPTCRWVGCEIPAEHTDADHTVEWSAGGPTSAQNLSHLCRRHHVLKHHGGMKLKQLGGGVLEWTLPDGERIIDEPHRVLPQAPIDLAPPEPEPPPIAPPF